MSDPVRDTTEPDDELEALKHDIERHIQIAVDLVQELEGERRMLRSLREALRDRCPLCPLLAEPVP